MPENATPSAGTPTAEEKKTAKPPREPWYSSRDLIAKNNKYWCSGGSRSAGLPPEHDPHP